MSGRSTSTSPGERSPVTTFAVASALTSRKSELEIVRNAITLAPIDKADGTSLTLCEDIEVELYVEMLRSGELDSSYFGSPYLNALAVG
jgi:hypothetical protein